MLYSKIAVKFPIRAAIVVPFLIQIIGVVGLTGWLSFRNGQEAVNEIAIELSNQIDDNIDKEVTEFLERSKLLLKVTESAISSDDLNLDEVDKLGRYFWHLVNQSPSGTTLEYGDENGKYVGVEKQQDKVTLLLLPSPNDPELKIYALDKQGKPSGLIDKKKYNPRVRPWYKTAVKAGKPSWTSVYLSASTQSGPLTVAAVNPIYNRAGKLRGVLGLEFTVTELSDFLRSLKIGKSGKAFIMERSGAIVATSADESPFITDGNEPKRLLATNSSNPLIKSTAQHLLEKFGSFKNIRNKQDITTNFAPNGQKQLVHIDTLQDERGLDLLVVVTIPEADFMEDIQAHTRKTILLCVASLLVAILLGLQTSKWIVKPILRLNTAAKKLSEGEWEQNLPVDRTDEIGALAKSFNSMTEQLKESFATLEQKVKDRTAELDEANADLEKKNLLIRQVFGRYLSDEVVANLLSSPEKLKLGGERRTITILTSDLRGFTATSERLSPEDVVKIINLYLQHMGDAIAKYQGTIDEFMGDGILILFGAPTVREDDAARAVACAVEMQLAMAAVNEKMESLGFPPLEMGIGINTGEVVVGNIGSDKRTKYGIVGSEVNLTYRMESYTVGGQIFITESTLKAAGKIVKVVGEMPVQPKGVKQPITIYEVGGIGGEYNLFMKKAEEVFFPLNEEIPIQYTVLDGKHISETIFKGSLVELSARRAKVSDNTGESNVVLSPLNNIKLNLLTPNHPTEDIYAKVLELQAEDGSFYIHFTNVPPAEKARLDEIYRTLERGG